MNNAYSNFYKILFNFYGKLMDEKYVVTSICRLFLTKFRYYFNYYVVIWR